MFNTYGFKLTFNNSLYPAATINFGPKAVCYRHTDAENDPVNLCHITALGRFNPTLGGHIILHTLKIAIEFPAGSTILIPSALLEHSNATIQPGEFRQSLTQWISGAMIRFADADLRMYGQIPEQDEFKVKLPTRHVGRVNLFSTIDGLRADRKDLLAAPPPPSL